MIRRLIILLLIVGCVFGDTIVYKVIGIKDKAKNVIYIGIKDNKVYYKEDTFIYNVKCNNVIEIINSDGNQIDFDCSSNTYIPKTLTELDTNKNPVIGGTLICIGGGLLMGNIDNEINNEDDLDNWKAQQQLGYGLIALGGILVTLGI